MGPDVAGRKQGKADARGEQERPGRPNVFFRGLDRRMIFLIGKGAAMASVGPFRRTARDQFEPRSSGSPPPAD